MNAQTIAAQIASRNPEDVQRRWRAYLEAVQPMTAAVARLLALHPRSITFFIGSDGKMTDLTPDPFDRLPPEAKEMLRYLNAQIEATARQYGFQVSLDTNQEPRQDAARDRTDC